MNLAAQTNQMLKDTRIIGEPLGSTQGYWTGAPGVFYAADEKAYYVTYRIRRPRGVVPDRGGEARIARSTDLNHFEDIWSVRKESYGTASIERSALRKGPDGLWRYFTSFVDPADGRWCVSVLKGSSVAKLDPATAQPVLTAQALGLEGIKDPWIFEADGNYCMILSVALPNHRTREESHETFDIFNTGECVSATGLAVSRDLDHWEWQGIVFAPGTSGWDVYCRRINSIIRQGEKYFAFYDGSASHLENYEEKTGLAVSTDLRRWQTLTPDGPALTSPHASGSLRYADVQVNGCGWMFYEFARADGAHEMRLAQVDLGTLLK